MWAILGGLGAATCWAVTTLTAARASRLIGSYATLAWVMLTGLLVVGPFVLAEGRPPELDGGAAGWLVVAGAGNVAGLLITYTALQIGKVGVIAPIESSEGAVAAVIATLAGESLGVGTGVRRWTAGTNSTVVSDRTRARRACCAACSSLAASCR